MIKIYRDDGTVIPTITMNLWTINKFLRFTGFCLLIGHGEDPDPAPAFIGLMWRGWKFLGREDWNGEEVKDNSN